jgi:phage baseplate assembly protein W
MENPENRSFLGTGWGFPVQFNTQTKSVELSSEQEDIRQALFIILMTKMGERVLRPDFGSQISDSVFGSIDSITVNRIEDQVSQAILEWEPRISLNNVLVDTDFMYDGRLDIKIDYTIRLINVRTNIVFPYYFKEGTNLRQEF